VSSTDLTLNASYRLIEIILLDRDFNQVTPEEWKVDLATGIVYSNLSNVFDTNDDDVVIYYIKYRFRTGNLISEYVDILNNQPIFTQADFDDLDSTLNIINDGRKVYLLTEQESGEYEVYLPEVSTYAFKVTAETKLQVVKSLELDLRSPWNVNITNATIYSRGTDTSYKYTLNEFANQSWDPNSPYKRILLEESYIVSSSVVKLGHNKLALSDDLNFQLDILIDDPDGDPVAAFTTDATLVGTEATNGATYQSWSLASRIGIQSIDQNTSMIQLEGVILTSNHRVYASYYYEENTFAFTSINLNPQSRYLRPSSCFLLFLIQPVYRTQRIFIIFLLIAAVSLHLIDGI
jgi:hypothetical protein